MIVSETNTAMSHARQANAFWASIRSVKQLCQHSKIFNEADEEQLNAELNTNLDEGIHIYPQALKRYGISQETPYKTKRVLLGLNESFREPTSIDAFRREQEFVDLMKQNSHDKRVRDWQWRAAQHAEEMQQAGWYPFFVTLTVDPKLYDPYEVWKPESKVFRKYIKQLCNVVTDTMGHTRCHKPPYNPQSNYITYIGSIEHGKSREHHHGHFMIWMRDVPADWKKDPNHGIGEQFRYHRECKQFRQYWPYSNQPDITQALYYRTKSDIWATKHGHVTPIDRESQQPIKIRGVRAVGAYITKYIQKDQKEWKHRIKATRNLGLTRLKQRLQTMPMQHLEALSWKPANSKQLHLVSLTHSVPQGLLRREAKLMNFCRSYLSRKLDLQTLLKSNSATYQKMLRSVHSGVRPSRMLSGEFYDWVAQFLPEETAYCESRLLSAHKLLSDEFPRPVRRVENNIVFGAANFGTPPGI